MSKDTVCKDCCFATWDDITQTGCQHLILNKYKKLGVNVLDCYDEDREFNVIKDRICPFKRSQQWLKRCQDTSSNIHDILKFESRLQFHIVIFVDINHTLNDILTTLHSLENQKLTPVYVSIIREFNNPIHPLEITKLLQGSIFPWRMQNPVEPMTKYHALHIAIRSMNLPYFVTLNAGSIIESDFLQIINDFVILELRQFAIILPDQHDFDGLVMPLSVYTFWYNCGDLTKSMLENILEWQQQTQKIVCLKIQDLKKIILDS